MENFLTTAFNVWFLVKALALMLLGMYIIFAFVVTRQVKMMTKTLHLGFEGLTKFLSYLHLAFALFVFFAALVVL